MIENFIDATHLKRSAPSKQIIKSIKSAIDANCYGFCTYMNNSLLVDKVIKQYKSSMKKIYVIGFPFGTFDLIKRDMNLLEGLSSADEFDLVIPVQFFEAKKFLRAHKVASGVRKRVKNKILKLIIETSLLSTERLPEAIKFAEDIGADIIKTNTGVYNFRKRPLVEDVKLIKEFSNLPIKCSGGIGTYKEAKELIDMGVCRIGTSKFKEMVAKEPNDEKNG